MSCKSTSRTRLIVACAIISAFAGRRPDPDGPWRAMEGTQRPASQPQRPRAGRRADAKPGGTRIQQTFPSTEPLRAAIPLRFLALVPAFNYFDARAYLSQSVFNFKNLEKERAASESVKAAQFTYKDAREMVVLAVGNAYLQAIAAGGSRRNHRSPGQERAGALRQGGRPAESRTESGHRCPALAGRTANPPAATHRRPQRSRQAEIECGADHRATSGPGVCAHRESSLSGTGRASARHLSATRLRRAPTIRPRWPRFGPRNFRAGPPRPGIIPRVDVAANLGDIGVTPASRTAPGR